MGRNHPKKKLITFLVSIFLIFLGVFLIVTPPFVDHLIYPVKYKDYIFTHANNTGMDPYLIMAIIRVETKFQPNEESRKGAEGLMQLMPGTVELAVKRGVSSFPIVDIKKPDINIQIGSWYLSVLQKEFKGNEVAAIASYNAGPGNVKKWLRDKRWDGTKENVDAIPFKETRDYVKRVYYFYGKYRNLYLK